MKLDSTMESRIIDALNNTWDAIGADILEANGKKDITRELVIEVVLDADSFSMYGDDEEAVAAFRVLEKEERKEVLRKAFPYNRYGY